MKYKSIQLVLFLLSFSAFGQQEELDTLHIYANKTIHGIQAISAKEIAFFQPNDVGEIIQKLPGMTIKSYGGIGGMKTVSVRGLGSVYQQIVMDGFAIPNTQTGMVNLGNIYTPDISSVELIPGSFSDELLPVSSILSANTLVIRRNENNNQPYSVKAQLKYGSFQTLDAFLSNRFNFKQKHHLQIDGGYRTSNGNYPYRFQNYQQTYTGKRKNADLSEWNAHLSYTFQPSKNMNFHFDYSFLNYDKGLPGAVILYLNSANQRLNGSTHRANLGWDLSYKKWKARFYSSYISDQLTYIDQGFLNQQGFLQSDYHQQQAQIGWVMKNQLYSFLSQNFGIESFLAKLTGDISDNVQPNRIQGRAFYELATNLNWGDIKINVAGQSLTDLNQRKLINKHHFYLQPGFFFQTKKDWNFIGDIIFFAKRVVRVPGLNDLYYNQIGNQKLKPEKANQFQLSFQKNYQIRKHSIRYGVNFYFNQEEDKIVAIPTKNLFVWMIQNVGKVNVLGSDIQFRYLKFWEQWNLSLTANYTFQSVTDRTDKNGSTFKNQIAYYPEHIGNLDIATTWKGIGFSVSTFAVSKRYALNENIPPNEINGYLTADAQISYQYKIKQQHQLTFRFTCKNIGNLSYAYVKYYVMPGINYLISLEYEF